MNIEQYQHIMSFDTGSTTYEYEIAKYFGIDVNRNMDDVMDDLTKTLQMKDVGFKVDVPFRFNGKEWIVEKDILDATFEQWVRLETILSEQDNLKNLHKLLSIYFRPSVKKMFRKPKIEKFDLNKQDEYSEELLKLPIEIANELMVFFYSNVPMYINSMKIQYLNLINREKNSYIKNQ